MIIDYLKEMKTLTSTEIAIKDYVLEHPRAVLELTIRDLAKACNVSVASVNRLSTKLGFRGFTDFKLNYIKEFKDAERMMAFEKPIPFNKDSTYQDVTEYIPYIYERTINYMRMSLDADVMMRCISQMKDAHIMVFGTGLNKALADIFVYKAQELSIECSAHDSLHYQFVEALQYRGRKLFAILITHSGVNRAIVTAAKRLHKNRVPSLLISCENTEKLNEYCPNRIHMARTGSTLELSNTQYMIATQYILDTIVSLLLIDNYDVVDHITPLTRGDHWTGE